MAYDRIDQFFAATPPLEALRLILSDAATEPPGVGASRRPGASGRKSSSSMPRRRTSMHPLRGTCAWSCRPIEPGPGYCCRLKRCLYGARDAPQQWGRLAASALEALGPGVAGRA